MQILSFLTHTAADNKHANKHQAQSNGQSYESNGAFIHISDSAGNQVTNEGNRCCRERVGQLSRNVVHVIRLRASRGHNSGITNGRAMVTGNSAREAGCDRNNQHLIGISSAKNIAHDGD